MRTEIITFLETQMKGQFKYTTQKEDCIAIMLTDKVDEDTLWDFEEDLESKAQSVDYDYSTYYHFEDFTFVVEPIEED